MEEARGAEPLAPCHRRGGGGRPSSLRLFHGFRLLPGTRRVRAKAGKESLHSADATCWRRRLAPSRFPAPSPMAASGSSGSMGKWLSSMQLSGSDVIEATDGDVLQDPSCPSTSPPLLSQLDFPIVEI